MVLHGLLLLDDQHPPDEAPKRLPNHYRACAPIGLEKPNEAAACEEGTGSRRDTPLCDGRHYPIQVGGLYPITHHTVGSDKGIVLHPPPSGTMGRAPRGLGEHIDEHIRVKDDGGGQVQAVRAWHQRLHHQG